MSNNSVLGKVLRFFLRLIPAHLQIPILQGRAKGYKWIVGSSTHGCWLGSYEFEKQLLFEKHIKPGDTVFDLGGHVGFYTLVASALVGSMGKVVVFEPASRNLLYLRRHLHLNHISNVTVIEAAVTDRRGCISFDTGKSSSMGHISHLGSEKVATISLDEAINEGGIPAPNCMKIDIEGAELLALMGAKSLLEKWHPAVFLSTHGSDIHRACCSLLEGLGYNLFCIDGKELSRSNDVLATYTSAGDNYTH